MDYGFRFQRTFEKIIRFIMSGEYLMRSVEVFSFYVTIKAAWELYLNAKAGKVYGSILHSYQHMAGLIGIFFYNIYDAWSFIYFEDHWDYSVGDYSVLFTNMLFLNLLWLILIDHFKQERLGKTKKTSFWDLFKF